MDTHNGGEPARTTTVAELTAVTTAELKPPPYELCSVRELQHGWTTVHRIGPGLQNHGNTCYLNSVLQCLTYCPILANHLLSGVHSDKCNIVGFCAFCSLEKHVGRVHKGQHSRGATLAPKELVLHVRNLAKHFKRGRQEDSHEFLRYLLDGLQKSCLRMAPVRPPPRVSETTVVHRIFGSHLRSRVRCSACGYCSNTYDATLDLSLDISKADALTKALRRFTRKEKLDGDNQYRCEKCAGLVDATKHLTLHTLPQLLTIELMRFGAVHGFSAKIRKPVGFDSELDLAPYTSAAADGGTPPGEAAGAGGPDEARYSLCGIVVHFGHSSHSGHCATCSAPAVICQPPC
jgi:ubiquitin carboxyl-terminal hydrolase 36/42